MITILFIDINITLYSLISINYVLISMDHLLIFPSCSMLIIPWPSADLNELTNLYWLYAKYTNSFILSHCTNQKEEKKHLNHNTISVSEQHLYIIKCWFKRKRIRKTNAEKRADSYPPTLKWPSMSINHNYGPQRVIVRCLVLVMFETKGRTHL